MNKNQIEQKIEEIDPEGLIPQDLVEELIQAIKDIEDQEIHSLKDVEEIGNLKTQLEKTTNWKERAIIAAKIISLNLE